MNPSVLIIFSGLPGTGKSTLASQLASKLHATYVRIDTIEQGLRDICGISEVEGKGYELAHCIATENLRLGSHVVADSVNPWMLTRKAWNKIAENLGKNFINCEIICSNKSEHQARIERRAASIPGLKLPTWQDVLARDYHSWSEDRIVIDTAGRTETESLQQLVNAIRYLKLIEMLTD